MNIILVNKYKRMIQGYINSQTTLPSPQVILKFLLKNYFGSSVSNFFESQSSVYRKFAKELFKQLDNSQFNLVSAVDDYLQANKLNQEEDFTSALLAFFYYYENLFSYSNYQNFKEQIIHPLHALKEKIKNDYVDFFIKQLQTDESNIKNTICLNIPLLRTTKQKQMEIIKQLLELFKNSNVFYKKISYALSQMVIPSEMEEIVLNTLIDKIITNEAFSNEIPKMLVHIVICEIFLTMKLSDASRLKLGQILLPYIDTNELLVKFSTWNVLRHINLPVSTIEVLIDTQLNILNTSSNVDELKGACQCLGSLKKMIANTLIARQKTVILALLEKADSTSIEVALSACQALGEISIYEPMLAMVIKKLIEKIDHAKFGFAACTALGQINLDIAKELQTLVIMKLIEQIKTKSHIGHGALFALENINIPKEILKEVIEAVLQIFKQDAEPYYLTGALSVLMKIKVPATMRFCVAEQLLKQEKIIPPTALHKWFYILFDVVASEVEFEQIINKFFEKLFDDSLNQYARTDMYAVLAQIAISNKTREMVFNRLISKMDDIDVCKLLEKFYLFKPQQEKVIKILLEKLTATTSKKYASAALQTIIALQKERTVEESIATYIQLENLLTASKKISITIIPYLQQLEELCSAKASALQEAATKQEDYRGSFISL